MLQNDLAIAYSKNGKCERSCPGAYEYCETGSVVRGGALRPFAIAYTQQISIEQAAEEFKEAHRALAPNDDTIRM